MCVVCVCVCVGHVYTQLMKLDNRSTVISEISLARAVELSICYQYQSQILIIFILFFLPRQKSF